MNLSSQAVDDAIVIHVHEKRIDAAIAIQFKDRVRELTNDPSERVILDMSQVEFVDSSGLGAIVSAMKFLAPDRRLELAGLTANVGKVFRLTRMDSVFPIHAKPPFQETGNAN
ncbi:MAG: STAS domain-containing protein [Rhodobacteraceae bacterium]|nr:STAS domain-containing protein [Paracoccaceae bacterium]MCP5341338.1 STAS domain-containing protein [Paracoccaceae bacterium]